MPTHRQTKIRNFEVKKFDELITNPNHLVGVGRLIVY